MNEEPTNNGGEERGDCLILKRSELAILRRYADRYPIVDDERREVVDNVMDVLRTSKSRRHRLSAANTMVSLDRVNLDEIKTYLVARKIVNEELQPAPGSTVNNTQINIVNLTPEQLKSMPADELARLHKETLALPLKDYDDGPGQS